MGIAGAEKGRRIEGASQIRQAPGNRGRGAAGTPRRAVN